jgi:putative oxidoreductase
MKLGITVLRLLVGGLFMGHGLQKLMGWFGGSGREATGQMFHSIGLRPGRLHATAAGAAETAGGAMLATGFLTPLGASMITGSMTVAVHKVHWRNGIWNTNQGFEYNAVLMASALAIASAGPGPLSLDHALGTERSGALIGLASVAAGALGGAAIVNLASRAPEEPEATEAENVRESEAQTVPAA